MIAWGKEIEYIFVFSKKFIIDKHREVGHDSIIKLLERQTNKQICRIIIEPHIDNIYTHSCINDVCMIKI